MKPRIVVVGSVNTDMMVHVHKLPQPGETVLGGDFIQSQGGKGANQAVAAARLEADVTFVARVGQDTFGKVAIASYEAEGIDTKYIVWDEQKPTGVALITVNSDGENTIAVAPGANAKLSPANILAAEPAIREANCLLVQLEIPMESVQEALQIAAKHHTRVILNPAPARQLPPALLELVDYLTPNQHEAAILAGNISTEQGGNAGLLLNTKFNVKNIVITLGEKGAQVIGLYNKIVPAYLIQPVDTTGAGDAFNGGLAVALAREENLIDAVKFANAVAALSTTHPGAQSSMPTANDVDVFLKLNQFPMR